MKVFTVQWENYCRKSSKPNIQGKQWPMPTLSLYWEKEKESEGERYKGKHIYSGVLSEREKMIFFRDCSWRTNDFYGPILILTAAFKAFHWKHLKVALCSFKFWIIYFFLSSIHKLQSCCRYGVLFSYIPSNRVTTVAPDNYNMINATQGKHNRGI